MKFFQLHIDGFDSPVSGADHRNEEIYQALASMGDACRLAIGNIVNPLPKRRRRTILPLDAPSIGQTVSLVRDFEPAVVVIEGVGLLRLASPLRQALPHAKIVFDFHNVETKLQEEIDTSRLPRILRGASPLIHARRWKMNLQADRQAAEFADMIWVPSKQDVRFANEIGIASAIDIVPNPFPRWCRPLRLPCNRQFPELLFVGHLGYRPNREAVTFLTKRIFPLLRNRMPGSRLTIAGRHANKRIKRTLANVDGVRLVEDPGELQPLYARADMVALPIFTGGGTRIKILEALSVGRPVIATHKAVEGLPLTAGTHFEHAEKATEFIDCIHRLFENPSRMIALSEAGQTIAEAYSRENICHAIRRSIEKITSDAECAKG